MKTYLTLLIATAIASFKAYSNENCWPAFHSRNFTYTKPVDGPIYQEMQFCWSYDGNNYRDFQKPMYWKPGTKLPSSIRGTIEDDFSERILELKGRGTFGIVLSYLLNSYSNQSYPKITSLLKSVGLISDTYNNTKARSELKKAIFDVLITRYTRLAYKGAYTKGIDAVIFYGLSKAKSFNVLSDPELDITEATNAIMQSLNTAETYNEKYKALDRKLAPLISIL